MQDSCPAVLTAAGITTNEQARQSRDRRAVAVLIHRATVEVAATARGYLPFLEPARPMTRPQRHRTQRQSHKPSEPLRSYDGQTEAVNRRRGPLSVAGREP